MAYETIHHIDGIKAVCPACGDDWSKWASTFYMTDRDGRDYLKCGRRARPYYRIGGSFRFESPDNLRVLIPEAAQPCTV